MNTGKRKYIVRLSSHTTQAVMASSPSSAKRKVWKDIEDGYTYGWSKSSFMRSARVELASRR